MTLYFAFAAFFLWIVWPSQKETALYYVALVVLSALWPLMLIFAAWRHRPVDTDS